MSGGFGSNLLVRTAFLSKIALLAKATSDDTEPTPGHLFYEINKITYESETMCRDLILWLNGRLRLTSATIKLKVLKVVKHLLVKGHLHFKIILRKQSNEISETCKFGGVSRTPDESLKCSQVRKQANELIELLYTFNEDSEEEQKKRKESCDFVGMGSLSSNRMVGFGHSSAPKENLSDALCRGVVDLAEKVAELTSSQKVGFYALSETSLLSDASLSSIIQNESIKFSKECQAANIDRDEPESSYEKKLVQQFITESDKSIYNAIKLFRKGFERADRYKLLKVTNEGLEGSDDDNTLRHMVLIEVVCRDGLYHFEDLYESCFKNLSSLYFNHIGSPVGTKAKKILLIMENFLPKHKEQFMNLRNRPAENQMLM